MAEQWPDMVDAEVFVRRAAEGVLVRFGLAPGLLDDLILDEWLARQSDDHIAAWDITCLRGDVVDPPLLDGRADDRCWPDMDD